MHSIRRATKIRFVSVLLFAVCVLGIQAQRGNPKIDGFLRAMPTFPNIDGARAAFQAAKFTESERAQLRDALSNPVYTPQITRLAGTITKTTFPSKPARTTVASRLAAEVRRIDALNKKLLGQLEGSKPSSTTSSGSDAPPRILSLSQETIEPGQYLSISGTGFLPAGRIQWTLGSKIVQGWPERWTDDLILVKLTNVQGIPDSPRSKVSICDQYFKPLTSAPIHFIPTWSFSEIYSDSLVPISHPYNTAAALIQYFLDPRSEWCSTYSMRFPDVPSYSLLNGWAIDELDYTCDLIYRTELGPGENDGAYTGWTSLPRQTQGELCQGVLMPGPITCVVILKGPLGLPFK
jgi:hypothetical protein